ncbi:AraC family transcriptional regulator [Pseudomonas aeruginosa]|uniref:AraC family transcriptional regulator n=1 Tax=Pseudomonas aeruginosa TaxID=287 RepID=UPI001F3C6567|nr:helix-turn-helix transcriptional regulator [Pseudomonas aeruginosa]MDU0680062.1 helix-turn-helix transcriptional regulator [Pseudomonas aeruginosa]HCF9478139.1 helix-turn-helix transcriptional regulator [Pseudomonas aeruginosa]
MSTITLLRLPDLQGQSFDVYFRYDEFGADTHSPPHTHAWGQLNYAAHGVMQLEIDGQRFLSPPQYAVWIPPERVHSCYNSQAIVYRSLYLSAELSRRLPATPCTLAISAILKAILSDFAERGVNLPTSAQDLRLARVVMDQLECAQPHDDYLPYGRTPALREVLDALQAEPGDNRSLAQWAQQVHSTERTLARHCQRELGMTFGEWRQRLRFLAAIEALEAGRGIQQIAFDLGYSSPSAFISMFRRLAGTTPEQYRLASRAQDMPML